MMKNIQTLLSANAYPGRGVVIGRTTKHAVIAYFIMGRSENSRNRIFTEKEGGIITEAFDISKLEDPSLIIYAPVRLVNEKVTVVTNGDQTDTIVNFLTNGKTWEEALRTRTFEPDAPNFTPRISGVLRIQEGEPSYQLSILKAGNANSPQRFFFDYPMPIVGQAHFIHTYKEDGDPIPSFEGEPVCIATEEDIDTFTQQVWHALNADNKVSLFVRYIDLATNETNTRIINKNGK